MNLNYFPHFIRIFHPELVNISDDVIIEIGSHFKQYLKEIFVDKLSKLDEIWNIDLLTVIPRIEHPLFVNGYHPALILHYERFVEIEKSKAIESMSESEIEEMEKELGKKIK